jgi:hypothetical protein
LIETRYRGERSEETKLKIGDAHRGRKYSEEVKQNMREAQRRRRAREKTITTSNLITED